MKKCSCCKNVKPIDDFHKQPSAKDGRHSYCAFCYNAKYRGVRRRKSDPKVRRIQNIKSRYGLSEKGLKDLFNEQDGKCAICKRSLERFHIDHCHVSGRVRGLLCLRCNIIIGGLDDIDFRKTAIAYLEKGELI